MNEIKTLKRQYTSVDGSFGGSQLYFMESRRPFSKSKKTGGCGVVAIGDVIAYLKSQSKFPDKETYMKYFNKISKRIGWIPNRFGLTFIQETLGMAHTLSKENLPYKCRWCFSKRKLYPRVHEMIDNDTPVILCIPKSIGPKRDLLPFYDKNLVKVNSTCGHFVVITGIHCEGNEIFFEISSWGTKYYINMKEFIRFQKKHLMGLLGNILYIKRK